MRILDVLTSPWAIVPEKLSEIRTIYRAHFHGEKVNWKGMQEKAAAIIGVDMPKPTEPYEIRNGVAVIPVSGVLTKGISFFSFLFGGSSMGKIGEAVRAAADDPAATSILLHIDSPGGTVDGTQELANIVFAAREKKPITAFSDGMMASAAYWIGSAAERIYISGDTVEVGSIGVVATHIDQSKWDEMMGDSYTEITAGHYKRIASSHKPLSKEGAAYIQEGVDHIYGVFLSDVARFRGVSEEKTMEMADGKIFIGTQAVNVGLVDGIATFDDLIESMAGGARSDFNATEKEVQTMDVNEIKTKNPALYQEIFDAGKAEGAKAAAASVEAVRAEGMEAGKVAERERISGIQAAILPGHEKIGQDAIADGKSTAGDVALKIIAAEREARGKALDAYGKDGKEIPTLPAAEAPPPRKDAKGLSQAQAGEKLDEIAKGIKAEKGMTYTAAFEEARKAHPELAAAYDNRRREE